MLCVESTTVKTSDGKGSRVRMVKVEERVDGVVRFGCGDWPYSYTQSEDEANNENATRTYSLERDIRSDFLYMADLFHWTLGVLGW